MIKAKTADLTGSALDWAVAQCEKLKVRVVEGNKYPHQVRECRPGLGKNFNPSTNWAEGGPIGERELLQASFCQGGPDSGFWACKKWVKNAAGLDIQVFQLGETELISKMRCHVATTLGLEIEIPKELA